MTDSDPPFDPNPPVGYSNPQPLNAQGAQYAQIPINAGAGKGTKLRPFLRKMAWVTGGVGVFVAISGTAGYFASRHSPLPLRTPEPISSIGGPDGLEQVGNLTIPFYQADKINQASRNNYDSGRLPIYFDTAIIIKGNLDHVSIKSKLDVTVYGNIVRSTIFLADSANINIVGSSDQAQLITGLSGTVSVNSVTKTNIVAEKISIRSIDEASVINGQLANVYSRDHTIFLRNAPASPRILPSPTR